MDYYLPIDAIRVSDKQWRRLAADKVARHIAALEDGGDLFPIDVNPLGDGTYTIAGNGRHRFAAYKEMGLTLIPVRY